MRYRHRTYVLLVLLGLLAACGQSDTSGAAKPAPSSEPASPATESGAAKPVPSSEPASPATEPATPPATSAPTEPVTSTVPPSTTTPAQQAIPTLQQAISGPATSRPLSTIATEQPTAPARSPGIVTFTDQGRTIQLAVGETFKLQLDTLHTWTIQIADERMLERVSDPNAGVVVQGVFRARARGRTTLEAEGEPTCRAANPPCMLPTIQFSVTIIVQ